MSSMRWATIRSVGQRMLPAIAVMLLLSGCERSGINDLQQFVANVKQHSPAPKLPPLPETSNYQPFYYQAQSLRDPFAPARFVVDALNRREAPATDNGIRPDINRPREELEKYALGALQLVGTFRDPQTGEMWALIKAPDNIVHKVHVGNYIGQNYGQIVSITENRIEIREIVRDPKTGGWQERPNSLSLAG